MVPSSSLSKKQVQRKHAIVMFPMYNKMTGELGDPQWWIILFHFYFLLLCNNLKCVGHYDSKGVCGIIQVDKY